MYKLKFSIGVLFCCFFFITTSFGNVTDSTLKSFAQKVSSPKVPGSASASAYVESIAASLSIMTARLNIKHSNDKAFFKSTIYKAI